MTKPGVQVQFCCQKGFQLFFRLPSQRSSSQTHRKFFPRQMYATQHSTFVRCGKRFPNEPTLLPGQLYEHETQDQCSQKLNNSDINLGTF